ncbi:hypothetical protein [Bradyrhizobium iriomotense]|uniref:Uncharacterized protein n=1 Tax=Bradyrhizobium iriomotense TaxID=441950 RepID=A0ABQ6B9W9_9BRAD|nr:hypothetical protein [Bradyrhizobium iriomotense]GLR89740.1 hypothetical protein GCM10007857_64540 [Bradyrhizobium iriomotense]
MSSIVRNFWGELIEPYPDLFQPPADFPGAAQGSLECNAGWHDVLTRLCVRIRIAVQADGGPFKFSQIKEKFGGLPLYWNGEVSPPTDTQIEEAIALAEARSVVTCEICGEEGRPRHFVDGKSHVSCRRYDRESVSFVSVDPASVGIEEYRRAPLDHV